MLERGYAEAVPCIQIRAYCQTKMENDCWNSADNTQIDNPSISSIISPPISHRPSIPSLFSLYPGMEIFRVRGLGGLWRRLATAKNGMKIMLLRIRSLPPLENLRYNVVGKIFTRMVFFFVTLLRLPTDDQ